MALALTAPAWSAARAGEADAAAAPVLAAGRRRRLNTAVEGRSGAWKSNWQEDEDEEDGGGWVPRGRRGGGGRNRSFYYRRQEEELEQVVEVLAKLVLSHDVSLRDLEAATYECYRMESVKNMVVQMKAAGKHYGEQTKGKRPEVHKLGIPLPYLVEAGLRGLHQDLPASAGKDELAKLHGLVTSPEEAKARFRHFRLRECYDKHYHKLTIQCADRTLAEAMKQALKAAGAEQLEGTAPPGGLFQAVSRWLG